MSAKITLTGAEDLIKKLERLEAKTAKKIGRKALRAGAKIVKTEMKSSAPVDQEAALPQSVKIKAGKRSRKRISIEVGIGDDKFKGDKYYATFVELGTSEQPPQDFMGSSAERVASKVGNVVAKELATGIEREAKK